MNDLPHTDGRDHSFDHELKSSDGKLYCRRCWRVEHHFHALREVNRPWFYFLRFATLGGLDLVGPYRCRCCGQWRIWGIDVRSEHRARQGSPVWKPRREARKEYKPFRDSFSVSHALRRTWRAIRRRFRGHDRRRRP